LVLNRLKYKAAIGCLFPFPPTTNSERDYNDK
jgi:hypothetical protein